MGNTFDNCPCFKTAMEKGGEAGRSLLGKVEDKFSDKMETVIDGQIMSKCDSLLDDTINQLVDATITKTLKSALSLAKKDGGEADPKVEEKSISELRKQQATQKLKDWGVSQMLITTMDQDGWLDERIWNELKKEQLLQLGFAEGHIALFLRGMERMNQRKDGAIKLLKEWKIPQNLIDNMNEQDYLDTTRWIELKYAHDDTQLRAMDFSADDIELFFDGIDKIYDHDHDDVNEYGINDSLSDEEVLRWLHGQGEEDKLRTLDWLDAKISGKKWLNITEDELYAHLCNYRLKDNQKEEVKLDPREEKEYRNRMEKVSKDIMEGIAEAILIRWNISTETIAKLNKNDFLSEEWLFRMVVNERQLKAWPQADRDTYVMQMEKRGQRKKTMKLKEKDEQMLLKKWKISRTSIRALKMDGKLNKASWNAIERPYLRKLGWTDTEVLNFLKETKKSTLAESQYAKKYGKDADPSDVLKDWGLPSDLINKLKEEGWAHPEYWGDLLDQEYYDLLDLGFRPGHISTFKRQYQRWKEEQDQATKERKIQLLRKLDSKTVKETSILKRNIDVQNDTKELIKVRIIGERKYDSFKSTAGASGQHQSKASARSDDKSSSMSTKSSKTQDTDSSKTSDKSLDVNLAVSGVPVGPVPASVGGSVGISKTDSTTENKKTHATQDNARDAASKSAQSRRNQSDEGSSASASAASKHQWQKVSVGFAEIMPKQTITFPVQISDPNAVVYMTIMVPSTGETICDNVQIDANFIRVEQVKFEGTVTKIKWQPAVKAPKNPHSKSIEYAKRGIIGADGLCDYMRAGKKPVDEWIIAAVYDKLAHSKYDIKDEDDMEALRRHVGNAVSIAVRLNKYDIMDKGKKEKYNTIEKFVAKDNEHIDQNMHSTSTKIMDLGTYQIDLERKQRKEDLLYAKNFEMNAGYDYTTDKDIKKNIAYIVKHDHRGKGVAGEDDNQYDTANIDLHTSSFVLIHSDKNWYKIGQRTKGKNRVTKEQLTEPMEMNEWHFWELDEEGRVIQSETDPNKFQYFQLIRYKNVEGVYNISTFKDGDPVSLGYSDEDGYRCLCALQGPKGLVKNAMKFRLHKIYHWSDPPVERKKPVDTTVSRFADPEQQEEEEDKPEQQEEEKKQEEEEEENTVQNTENTVKKNKNTVQNTENTQLISLISLYIEMNQKVGDFKGRNDDGKSDINDEVLQTIYESKSEGIPNEILKTIYEHKLSSKAAADGKGMLNTQELCTFMKQFNFISSKKLKFIEDSLGNASFDISEESELSTTKKEEFLKVVAESLAIYDQLWGAFKETEDDKSITEDIDAIVEDYKAIVHDIMTVYTDHSAHSKKCETVSSYADHDSDDEELRSVNKFFDVDGYSILKKWKLEQFYERMVDEGWSNPLDWVHLDDWILRQNLGFRPGHIQIFNRKYDLWVKKYNDVRRTIPAKRKGKDGVLIVAAATRKMLEPNHKYEFTKIIVRKDAILTTKSWSPSNPRGGVLLLRSFQEVVLEEGARIDVSGKGYWGSVKPGEKGWGPKTGIGGGGSVGWYQCGAGGGGYATKGGTGYTPNRFRCLHYEKDFQSGKSIKTIKEMEKINENKNEELQAEADENQDENKPNDNKCAIDEDIYHGESGSVYGDRKLSVLHLIDYEKHFEDNGDATDDAIQSHCWSLGSGGGYHQEEKESDASFRGGNGGGSLAIICDKLVMYDRSSIVANGIFASNENDKTSGGSGGSIYLRIETEIKTFTRDDITATKKGGVFMTLKALGGGKEHRKLSNSLLLRGIPVGLGSDGRIRIDYHSPSQIRSNHVRPYAYIEEGNDGETKVFKPLESAMELQTQADGAAAIFQQGDYLIQSAYNDEIVMPYNPKWKNNITNYWNENSMHQKEYEIGLVLEPLFLYGNQSWLFVPEKEDENADGNQQINATNDGVRFAQYNTRKGIYSWIQEKKTDDSSVGVNLLLKNVDKQFKDLEEKEEKKEELFVKDGTIFKLKRRGADKFEITMGDGTLSLFVDSEMRSLTDAYIKTQSSAKKKKSSAKINSARQLPKQSLCSRVRLKPFKENEDRFLFYIHPFWQQTAGTVSATKSQAGSVLSGDSGRSRPQEEEAPNGV